MTTKVDICNEALIILGEPQLATVPQEGSKNSYVMDTMYETRRDYLLRSYIWKFAKKQIILAPTATTPTFDWSYAFDLPSDYLRVVKNEDFVEGLYAMMGKQILSNGDVFYLTYCRQVTDPNNFDAIFTVALGALLARDSSQNIKGQFSKLAGSLFSQYISEARMVDSIEKEYGVISASDWEEARA